MGQEKPNKTWNPRRLQTVDCKRCLAIVARPVTRDAQVLQPEQLSPRRIG